MALHLEGGCLCGDIRYKVAGELHPDDRPSLCHCRTCQQATGAPVVPWATFNEKDIVITRGEPKVYHSSETAVRKFCGRCGTQIFYHRRGSHMLEITTVSLDTPDAIQPERQIWLQSQRKCLSTRDSLPKYQQE